MNDNDMAEIIALFEVYYPSFFKDFSDAKIEIMIQVWTEKFKQYTKDQMRLAVERISSKSKYMPSVADIIGEIEEIKNPILKTTAEEEWNVVEESMRKFGQYKAKKAYELFSPLTKEIVDKMGYYNLCTSELGYADRKEFIDLYNIKQKEIRELNVMGRYLTTSEIEKKQLLESTVFLQIENQTGREIKKLNV